MAKYYSPREMKGEREKSIELQKIKVSIVENVYTTVKPENRVRHIDDLEFTILQNEEGRYNLEWLEDYIKREYKLLIERTSRPLKGKTSATRICIDIVCRAPLFKHEKEELGVQ